MPASDKYGNQNFTIKLIDNETNDEIEVTTTKIINNYSFLISVSLNENGINEKITKNTYFLYGQLVDDFHKIDVDQIHNITTAALQEVDRQQQSDKARIAELEQEVATQKSTIATILDRLEKIETKSQ